MRANRRWGRALLPALVAGAVLACAGTASAATCTYSASGNWTTGGSCGATPAATDTVVINSGVNVAVDASHTIAGITMNGGTITFSGTSPTLTDTGPLSTSSNNLLTGDGALTVGGTQDNSSGQLTLEESADLVLNSTSGLSGGSICTLGSGPGTTDDPSVQINGTFTIGSGADASPVSCNSFINTGAIQVGATGVLVDARPGTTDIGTPIQVAQGGLVHVTTGMLSIDGGSAGATDDGEWSVDANTTLRFTGSNQLNTLGSHTSIHGAGTFDVFNTVTVPLGATFTIAHLTIELATVELDDNATTYTPNTVTLNAGTLAGDRDVTPSDSFTDATGGGVTGPFTTTIGPSTALTISAQLGVADRSRFVLNRDFTLGAGANICLLGTGPGTSDDPAFETNSTLTIGSTADADPFSCNSGVNSPAVLVGATGTLVDARAGATSTAVPIGNAGTVGVGNGQTLAPPEYDQTGGTTTVASGGALGGAVTLTGGVLKGGGTLTGSLTNTSGSVQPGASPGILSVDGNYSQGSGGTLQVDIDGTSPGTQYDQLAVGGDASLDGTLSIVTGGGFHPALTDRFDVVTATGTVAGAFATLTGAQLSGEKYSAEYTAGPPGKATLALGPSPAPGNQTPPSIPSHAHPGDHVSCDPGTWSGSPSFTFQWLRDGTSIASGQSYVVAAGDVGHALVCRVTASNPGGDSNADSNTLVPTAPAGTVAPPANTAPPQIPTSAAPDDTLRCDPGSWSGSPTFTFQWLRDGTPIPGATSALYIVASGDVGHALSCSVTATNAGGSTTATSNSVTPQAPPIKVAGLPPSKGCVPGRVTLKLRVRPEGFVKAAVLLDGKRIAGSTKSRFVVAIPKRKLKAGRHNVTVAATYKTGTINKRFSFATCRGGGFSPKIRIGGQPPRSACVNRDFALRVVIKGAQPRTVRVTLDGKTVRRPGAARFHQAFHAASIRSGRHTVVVVAADRFGNTSRYTIDFVRC